MVDIINSNDVEANDLSYISNEPTNTYVDYNDIKFLPDSFKHMRDLLMSKDVIVVDCDEVLTDISIDVYNHLYNNKHIYGKSYKLDHYSMIDFHTRKVPFVNKWLEFGKFDQGLHDSIMFYLRNFPYHLKEANPIVKLLIDVLVSDPNKKLFVLSTTIDDNAIEPKQRFINRIFYGLDAQVTYLPVMWDKEETKSLVLMRGLTDAGLNDFDVFIDDDLKNIDDVMRNTFPYTDHTAVRFFFCPKWNYNCRKFNEVSRYILDYRSQLLWYDRNSLDLKPENPKSDNAVAIGERMF